MIKQSAKYGTRMVILLGVLISVTLWVSGCSLPTRKSAVPQSLSSKAEVPGLSGVRYLITPGTMGELSKESMASYYREKSYRAEHRQSVDPMPKASFLALSGGGDDVAFGALALARVDKGRNTPRIQVGDGQ